MVSRVQNIRSSSKNTRPPNTTRQPGEIYVNFADLQLGVITPGQSPQDLIAIRFFSADTDYATGDHVIQAGRAYRAKAPIPAGPFDATEWETAGMADAPTDNRFYGRVNNAWDIPEIGDVNQLQAQLDLKAPITSPSFAGVPLAPTAAAATSSTQIATTEFVKSQNYAVIGGADLAGKVSKSGDTMTGPLTLNAAPTVPLHAATKGYVDAKPSGASVADTAPTAPVNGQMWWESDTGALYVYYDDLTSQAWVQLNAAVVDAYSKTQSDQRFLTDAPADGNLYARASNLWVPSASAHGQCRLRLEGANLVLRPYNGNKLIINGRVETIPDGGVSLSPAGRPPTMTVYVYASMSGGTMLLEGLDKNIGANAHARDPATGVEIRTGDPTRTLVGMAYVQGGPAWGASPLHLSYFNRANIGGLGAGGSGSTASTSMVDLNANARIQCLNWADEMVTVSAAGTISNNTTGQFVAIGLIRDSALAYLATSSSHHSAAGNYAGAFGICHPILSTEGYHNYNIGGSVSAGTGGVSWQMSAMTRG